MSRALLPAVYAGLAYACLRIATAAAYKYLLPGVPDAGAVPAPMLPWLLGKEVLSRPSWVTSQVLLLACTTFLLPPAIGLVMSGAYSAGGVVAVEMGVFWAIASGEIWAVRSIAVAGEHTEAHRTWGLWVAGSVSLLCLVGGGMLLGLVGRWLLHARGIDWGRVEGSQLKKANGRWWSV